MGKTSQVKYKKAPQAPRRFKSSYMFYSTEKHRLIRQELAEKGETEKLSTTKVAKLVSQAWKDISDEERKYWDEIAKKDKARYEMEKSMYAGPWKVLAKKRSHKDPSAPKRPMSAFLSFSNSKRALVREKHPDAGNAEVSRILAQMWKDASPEERKEHVDQEFKLRQDYKLAIAEWRENSEIEIESARKEREDQAMKAVLDGRPLGSQKHSIYNHPEALRKHGQMVQYQQEGIVDESADVNGPSHHTEQPLYHQPTQGQSYIHAGTPPYYLPPPPPQYHHYFQQHNYHHPQFYNNDPIALPPHDGGGYPFDHSGAYTPGVSSIGMVNPAADVTGYPGGAYYDDTMAGQQQHYHHYPQHHYPANNAHDSQQPSPASNSIFQHIQHADTSHDETMQRIVRGNPYKSTYDDNMHGQQQRSDDTTNGTNFAPSRAKYQYPQDPHTNRQNHYYYGGGTYHSTNSH